jgi:hypothetical protein
VRLARFLPIALCIGALPALLAAPVGGCAYGCDAFLECTARPGLRYVACDDDRHEFNDGTSQQDRDAALDYCFCSKDLLECVDGPSLSLCNLKPFDGREVTVDPGGNLAYLPDSVRDCLQYETCTIETMDCKFNGWYLRCDTGGGGMRYVTAGAKVVTLEAEALQSCKLPGGDDPGGDGYCTEAIDDCAELAVCSASVACYSDILLECRSSPLCSFNDDLNSCAADPACEWMTY